MDVKQLFDHNNIEIIKMEPDLVSDQIDGNYCCTKDKTFKNNKYYVLGDNDNICEYQTTREFVNVDGIKQECELPKIEGSDFLENFEYESVPENVNDIKAADIGDIKPVINEINEYVQFKNESELLTSHCDLPTLNSEVKFTDYPNYFAQPCSSKQILIKSKSSKHTVRNVPKQKKRGYPWFVLKKTFRSPRENLFNLQFGRSYETCYYCGQIFLTKSQFLFHFIAIHYVKKVTKFSKRKFGQYKHCRCENCLNTIFKDRPIANMSHSNDKNCEISSKRIPIEINLNNHIKMHTGKKLYKCNICLKRYTQKHNLEKHLKIHTVEKPFKCEICSMRFIEKSDIKKHLIIHTGEKPFQCEICSKQFTEKGNLKCHLKSHTGEKPFKCEICSKLFTHKGDLNKHLTVHTGEKPFKCEICSKRFIQKSYLKKHQLIHTGEKPFECKICSKQFTQKSSLNFHLKIHAGEKLFHCEICSKLFTQKIDLKRHLKIHTGEKPFKCEICSKQFILKNDLKKHSRIHTGEKPFECEICSKRFIQKSHLKKHSIIHTGEKPFECEICLKRFTQKSHLKKHSIIHTGKYI
ncbi:unnamed protein product [Psylliodes chrysocephalus]|uniref:C2H2-type domain-containing protein n=1 Tax=Psylliodes chrysocephalus TaxID=3402493 RepID=A0A9P0DAU7_9CUCU|nr:unnamed protein product [Psylliodes chrysocephala]